ncbi:MAG TPA: response regulator [Burkholderiales bacterium]|jgi:FixJ family two-component response regulator|nr:response regulator [Burkholderiales bacterium]
MQPEPLTVYIVDDDASVRDSLALMLGLAGYRTAFFADAEAFLAAWRADWAGCVIADLRLPGASGIELQAEMHRRGSPLPFIIITAHGDVPAARAAFRADAVDFLEKPFDHEQLRAAIGNAFSKENLRLRRAADAGRLGLLTAREREVLAAAARGLHAKEIARELGISARTVEVHKTRIMAKLGARNVAELVRFALAAEPPPAAK